MKKITLLCFLCLICYSCTGLKFTQSTLGEGWSNNSVNVVVFRNSALTTHGNTQFAAYYAPDSVMVLAKRTLGSTKWQTKRTVFKGNVKDAHNDISIAVDAKGYVHVSWDHHDTRLRYACSSTPLGLDLGNEQSMTGLQEEKVTYPEFHNLPDGKLLFCYRSGKSGRGNMVMNIYNPENQEWKQIQNNLLDGEGQRSAYWQMCTGPKGIYLSWTWRESWDVSTNHDICYAFSPDGGNTWLRSDGTQYTLPITASTAETVWTIPQNSSLINQTSMAVDEAGKPYITNYWDSGKGPQYKVVYYNGKQWKLLDSDFITTPFKLGGGGTKSIPISRPKLLVYQEKVYLLFRDAGRDNHISVGIASTQTGTWKVRDIVTENQGQWEPNYDEALWQAKHKLHIFCQKVSQADGEGLLNVAPEPVKVIEVNKFQLLDKRFF